MAGMVGRGLRGLGMMKKIPFFLPFGGCAGRCVYCHQETITGVSGLIQPEAVARRLSGEDKPVEACFFGGSFCRMEFAAIRAYLDAVRDFAPAGSRIRFSTYPGDLRDRRLRELVSSYSIACVELGIPSLDPDVLRACKRDADPDAILSDVASLRDLGFPLGVQVMIGLPSQTPESSVRDIKALADAKGAQDCDLRIYPALVLEDTELLRMASDGVYKPLSTAEAAEWGGFLLDAATSLGFRPIRVGLQETDSLAAHVRGGPHYPALGELIAADALARKLARETPGGPWTIPRRHISKLTGHGAYGTGRLAFYSGADEDEVLRRISLFTQTRTRAKSK